MKKLKNVLVLVLGSFFFASCEKVIDVDLNEENPLLVIDGGITNRGVADTIRLSKTGSYTGESTYQKVGGADVEISDNLGNREMLKEISAGTYVTQDLRPEPGRPYQMNINSDGKAYTAIAVMPEPVEIGGLAYTMKERSLGTREGNYVTVFFDDPPGVDNYYLVKANGNSMSFNNGSDQFFVFTDQLFNGGKAAVELPFYHFGNGMANISLFSIDRKAYDYYIALNEIIQNPGPSPFSGVPQNAAKSNVQGGAIGYFTVFSVSESSIRIH